MVLSSSALNDLTRQSRISTEQMSLSRLYSLDPNQPTTERKQTQIRSPLTSASIAETFAPIFAKHPTMSKGDVLSRYGFSEEFVAMFVDEKLNGRSLATLLNMNHVGTKTLQTGQYETYIKALSTIK